MSIRQAEAVTRDPETEQISTPHVRISPRGIGDTPSTIESASKENKGKKGFIVCNMMRSALRCFGRLFLKIFFCFNWFFKSKKEAPRPLDKDVDIRDIEEKIERIRNENALPKDILAAIAECHHPVRHMIRLTVGKSAYESLPLEERIKIRIQNGFQAFSEELYINLGAKIISENPHVAVKCLLDIYKEQIYTRKYLGSDAFQEMKEITSTI